MVRVFDGRAVGAPPVGSWVVRVDEVALSVGLFEGEGFAVGLFDGVGLAVGLFDGVGLAVGLFDGVGLADGPWLGA